MCTAHKKYLVLKGMKFIIWMCLKLSWHLQIYFKENNDEEHLEGSHREDISETYTV